MTRRIDPELEGFREEVRAFTAEIGDEPRHADLDSRFEHLVGFQRSLHAAGLAVPTWPVALGGRGLGAAAAAIVSDELGRAGAPEVINFVATDIVAPTLMRYAEPDRLAALLPPMAGADEIWCQLFSEPDAGSDLAALRTRAVPSDDGWRVTGEKVWSTWAQFARYGLLLARTGELEQRHRSLTAFVVDMRRPGVSVHPLTTMTGEDEFAAVRFDDVELDAGAVVGEVGDGWAVAMHVLGFERGPYAVRRASVVRGSVERLLRAARAATTPADVRRDVVDAYIAMELLDLQIDRVIDQLDTGLDGSTSAPITKRLLTHADQATFAASHRLHGVSGIAWTPGAPGEQIASDFLYSRAASIYGGSQEIQRNIIAERLLGLPRELAAR